MIQVKLTTREMQVASLAGCGYTSKYIASVMHLSVRTIETHLGHIYGKLAVSNRDELIDYVRATQYLKESVA